MVQITVNGREYELPAMQASGIGGGFLFGLAKGGSVMLNTAARRLTNNSPVGYVSLTDHFGPMEIPFIQTPFNDADRLTLYDYLSTPGIVFGGWRKVPKNLHLPIAKTTRTFLLVRDPRDMLTSHYFHMKFSARTEGAPQAAKVMEARKTDVDIDSFVLLNANEFLDRITSYNDLADRSDLVLRRYEDVIFDKVGLVKDLCDQFAIPVRQAKLARIAAAIDVRPEGEDPYAHVRQVAPGDHKRKLKPETIGALNEIFREVLRKYDYAPWP